jgi:hypothetical protein
VYPFSEAADTPRISLVCELMLEVSKNAMIVERMKSSKFTKVLIKCMLAPARRRWAWVNSVGGAENVQEPLPMGNG